VPSVEWSSTENPFVRSGVRALSRTSTLPCTGVKRRLARKTATTASAVPIETTCTARTQVSEGRNLAMPTPEDCAAITNDR